MEHASGVQHTSPRQRPGLKHHDKWRPEEERDGRPFSAAKNSNLQPGALPGLTYQDAVGVSRLKWVADSGFSHRGEKRRFLLPRQVKKPVFPGCQPVRATRLSPVMFASPMFSELVRLTALP